MFTLTGLPSKASRRSFLPQESHATSRDQLIAQLPYPSMVLWDQKKKGISLANDNDKIAKDPLVDFLVCPRPLIRAKLPQLFSW